MFFTPDPQPAAVEDVIDPAIQQFDGRKVIVDFRCLPRYVFEVVGKVGSASVSPSGRPGWSGACARWPCCRSNRCR
jgi:hypothetical protein